MESTELCPVCGYELDFSPWKEGVGSQEICPCCGIQFGYDDAAGGDAAVRQSLYVRMRNDWIQAGKIWRHSNPPPDSWDPDQQLEKLYNQAPQSQNPPALPSRPEEPTAPKSFPALSRSTRRLTITPDGATLLHSAGSRVAVWDIENRRLRCSLQGSLVGVSTDGKTFLTRHVDDEYLRKDVATLSGAFRIEFDKYAEPPCDFKAWETRSGKELDLEEIAPETYQLYQRVDVTANRIKPALRTTDLPGRGGPSKEIVLNYDGLLENWAMAPDNRHIALVYYVGEGGFDTTVGHCVDALTGELAYEFKATSTAESLPKIYFSAEHKRMISNHAGNFDIYDLDTGLHLHSISEFDEAPHRFWGVCFAVDPVDRNRLAMSYSQEPYMHWDEELRRKRRDWRAEDYTHSAVIAEVSGRSNVARVTAILKQGNAIDEIEFFPDGNRIAVLLSSGEIRIWDITAKELLATLSAASAHVE